jgi:hypothetical protein
MRVMVEKEVLEVSEEGKREVRIHTDVYDVSDFSFANSRPNDLELNLRDLEDICLGRGVYVKGSVSVDVVEYSHMLTSDFFEDGDSHIVFIEFYA